MGGGAAFVEAAKETFDRVSFVIPVPLFLIGGAWGSSNLKSTGDLVFTRSTVYNPRLCFREWSLTERKLLVF